MQAYGLQVGCIPTECLFVWGVRFLPSDTSLRLAKQENESFIESLYSVGMYPYGLRSYVEKLFMNFLLTFYLWIKNANAGASS
jgi:hypothetical protein